MLYTLVPAMILFDSLDGNVHSNQKEIKELNYFEYAEVWFDGKAYMALSIYSYK